jgi:hypothetical protein
MSPRWTEGQLQGSCTGVWKSSFTGTHTPHTHVHAHTHTQSHPHPHPHPHRHPHRHKTIADNRDVRARIDTERSKKCESAGADTHTCLCVGMDSFMGGYQLVQGVRPINTKHISWGGESFVLSQELRKGIDGGRKRGMRKKSEGG